MKKTLSVLLAVILMIGMSLTAIAADDITRPGTKIALAVLDPADFAEFAEAPPQKLTKNDMNRWKLDVKKKVSTGGDMIKEVKLENVKSGGIDTVQIIVELKDPIPTVKDRDLNVTVYLTHKGSKLGAPFEWDLTTTVNNEEITVDGDDSVNLSEGAYAKATSYTKAIKVDTGNGLFIATKMFEDQKYYAKSVQEITTADEAITSSYPEITTIYNLYLINMNSASNIVTFDLPDKYYVYNVDGKYIGTTVEQLPLSTKYYLATKEIDMNS